MAEFFLSPDFGMLLGVFIFGVSISGRLAAWGRAFVARVAYFRKNLVRNRVKFLEREMKRQYNIGLDHEDRLLSLESVKANRDTDLEDRIKVLEDIVVEFLDEGNDADFSKRKERAAEIVSFLKKKAKERAEAIKKLN